MKKWRYIVFLLLPFSVIKVNAQTNLVINPSFEEYEYQPCHNNGFNSNCASSTIPGWYDPTYSPGYWFNSCDNGISPDAGVPSNYFGYQYAHSGQAYGDIYVDGYIHNGQPEPTARGYLTGQFSKPLIAGKTYCVNFYISLEDSIGWYAVSAIGAFISDTAPCVPNYYGILTGTPQIENPFNSLLSDKKDWVPISGEYLAKGGEYYITIGDFYSDAMSDWTYIGGGGNNFDTSTTIPEPGYYLDDVSVREIHFANARLSKSVGQAFNGSKDTTICYGKTVIIGGDTAMPGVSYQWQPTTGLQNPNAAQTMASSTVTTTYTLFVHNDSMFAWNAVGGCHCPDSVSRDSVTIKVITVNGNVCCDTSIILGQEVQLNASGGIRYAWVPQTSCDTCSNPMVTPSVTTTYIVTITNDSGCSTTREVKVDVTCGNVFIPDAFSPAPYGSGRPNGVLYVRGPCISTMDFVIFDRWGNKVFESQNQSKGWDGTYKGQTMSTGTYMYYLTAKMNDGTSVVKKGNVALIR